MVFNYGKRTNRLIVATIIALSGAVFAHPVAAKPTRPQQNSPAVQSYTTHYSLDNWEIGDVESGSISAVVKGQIKSSNCNADDKRPYNRMNILGNPNKPKTAGKKCPKHLATAKVTDRIIYNSQSKKFTGSLTVQGDISRGASDTKGSLLASSNLTINVSTKQPKGKLTPQTSLRCRTIGTLTCPRFNEFLTFVTADSDRKSAGSLVAGNRISADTESGTLFSATSTLDGQINWDGDSIDFSNVTTGMFGLEFGQYTNKQGKLLVEFQDGRIVNQEDSGFFDGWLEGIESNGAIGTFSFNNATVGDSYGFDFDYDLSRFDGQLITFTSFTENELERRPGEGVEVPEPITIIGTFASLGFGFFFKRKYGKGIK
jgi:hypothetical protein